MNRGTLDCYLDMLELIALANYILDRVDSHFDSPSFSPMEYFAPSAGFAGKAVDRSFNSDQGG
jgi:hypothetical protein